MFVIGIGFKNLKIIHMVPDVFLFVCVLNYYTKYVIIYSINCVLTSNKNNFICIIINFK